MMDQMAFHPGVIGYIEWRIDPHRPLMRSNDRTCDLVGPTVQPSSVFPRKLVARLHQAVGLFFQLAPRRGDGWRGVSTSADGLMARDWLQSS